MELKNAVAVCLITLLSATLVVLIARSLDSQAAARLEPQLIRIAEELEAIRKAGGITTGTGGAAEDVSVDNGLIVYYFHSNTRCPTCRAIESQSHDTVQSDFASQLTSGEVVWKKLNYERPEGVELQKKFEIQMPVVVLAKMKDGQIEDWRRLDRVWALVSDKSAFTDYVRDEIGQMLDPTDKQPNVTPPDDAPLIPVPDAMSPDDTPPLLPIPAPESQEG